MKEKNMTALVSAFARCYHYQNNKKWIYKDELASKIISKEEYNLVATSMAQGIHFFNKYFEGTREEALRWIVNKNLSPSVLGRSAFCEKMLESS
ncbi:MAG: class I SAM-dependent methyltransferase, partial [Bacilli bacterium]